MISILLRHPTIKSCSIVKNEVTMSRRSYFTLFEIHASAAVAVVDDDSKATSQPQRGQVSRHAAEGH
jgi:hypothetical protein